MRNTDVEMANGTARARNARNARQRRVTLALGDLGLLALVGSEWLVITDEGAKFADLDAAAMNRLLCRLEDLAAFVPDWRPTPGIGQLTLDFDAIEGPAPLVREDDGHIPVWTFG